jgi:GNAT superfamily N-acetyltransferase
MLTIREAGAADEAALVELTPRLAAFPVPSWRTAGEIAEADRPILRAALRGELDGAVVLVAEDEGEGIVGFVFATTKSDYFTREAHGHVEVLVVAPSAEGRGVASRLMEAIEAWARSRRLAWMTLNVFDGNARARQVYEHLGYEAETIHYRKAL